MGNEAPFGRDEDGKPIAPYGLKSDGTPYKINRKSGRRRRWEPGETKLHYADGKPKPLAAKAASRVKHPNCQCSHRYRSHDVFGCFNCDECTGYVSRNEPPREQVPLEAKIAGVRSVLARKGFVAYSPDSGVATCQRCFETVRVGYADAPSERILLAAHSHIEKRCKRASPTAHVG